MKKIFLFTFSLLTFIVNAQNKLADISTSDSAEFYKIIATWKNDRLALGAKNDFINPTDGKDDTFCIKKTYPPSEKKNNGPVIPAYSIQKSSASGKKLKPVAIENRAITSCLVMFDPFQNDIVVYGFYCDLKLSPKYRTDRQRGFYVQRINPETFEVKLTKATDFSADCIKEGGQMLPESGGGPIEGELEAYRLDEYARILRESKSDGIYIEAEQANEKHQYTGTRISNSGTITNNGSAEFIGNILALKINPDGSLAYTTIVRKLQLLSNGDDIPKTNFEFCCTVNNTRYIFYNDHLKNLEPNKKNLKSYSENSGNNCLVLVKIGSNGSVEREIIKSYEKKEGVCILKYYSAHISDAKEVVFKTTEGTYLKVVLH